MKRILRKLIPQKVINYSKHLPTAVVANLKYRFPSNKIKVIGVTGTDGKTTTTNMIYQILKKSGRKVSMVSTINAEIAGKSYDTGFHVTNPDPMMLQKFIRQAVNQGDEYLVLEVTSHGLDQFRSWGVNFEVGVITNITHEHLDYHKTWENYFLAKAKLLKNVKVAVLNSDEKHFSRLKKLTTGKIVSFGFSKEADFNPEKFKLQLGIPGDHNLLNALAAAAVVRQLGIALETIKIILKDFKSLEGRMEEITNNRGIKVIVDFAHTPFALEQALKTLRLQTKGRVISVFGCAGYRDEQKRPLMGEISARLADLTVITAEDPRGLIEQINREILTGAEKAGGKIGQNVFVENNRQQAIGLAINKLAKKGDIVGVFGKGHEKSNNLDGKNEVPWSDQKAVQEALKNNG